MEFYNQLKTIHLWSSDYFVNNSFQKIELTYIKNLNCVQEFVFMFPVSILVKANSTI
jgi:hypothetical protein